MFEIGSHGPDAPDKLQTRSNSYVFLELKNINDKHSKVSGLVLVGQPFWYVGNPGGFCRQLRVQTAAKRVAGPRGVGRVEPRPIDQVIHNAFLGYTKNLRTKGQHPSAMSSLCWTTAMLSDDVFFGVRLLLTKVGLISYSLRANSR